MDKNFAFAKSTTATLQPKITAAGQVGSLQDKKGFCAGDIGNLAVPGAIDGTGLKVLLGKGVNQGLLELDGANYMVKGHAKKASKGRKKSAGGKKGGKKASKSKGRKKSAAPKKGKNGKKGEEVPK